MKKILTALILAMALAPLWSLATAGAQEGDDKRAPQVQSWAVTPSGSSPDEPSSRPYLDYTVDPGETIEDSVTVWNYGNVQLTFKIYATDAFNNADGAFDLLPGDKQPKDAGTWAQLPQRFITVPPGTRIDLPIRITVPGDAAPGDHSGAILATNEAEGKGPDGKTVTLDRRTGTRLYVRVNGPLDPALAVTRTRAVYHGALDPRRGSLDVRYIVRNVGNVRLGAQQSVELNGLFGRTMQRATPRAIQELLPGNEVEVVQHFKGVTAALRVSADITLTPTAPAGTDSGALSPTNRSARTWAFPWLLLAVAIALGVLVHVLRRRHRGHPPVGPPAGLTIPPAPPPSESREPVGAGR